MNQYYLPWGAGTLYHTTHVHDGAQLVELMRVMFKLKLTFAHLVVMIRQVHDTFLASTNSTLSWVSENNPSTDRGRVSTTCGRNPGFQAERGFLVRLIWNNTWPNGYGRNVDEEQAHLLAWILDGHAAPAWDVVRPHTLTKQKDCPPYFRTCDIHTIPITCIFTFHAHIFAYTSTAMLPSGCL